MVETPTSQVRQAGEQQNPPATELELSSEPETAPTDDPASGTDDAAVLAELERQLHDPPHGSLAVGWAD